MSTNSRELTAELARRAIAAAERRQAEADARELAAAKLLEEQQAARDEINAAIRGAGRRPPAPEPDPPPAKPLGSANAGEGDAGPEPVYDYTRDGQRFRVWPLDDNNDKETET